MLNNVNEVEFNFLQNIEIIIRKHSCKFNEGKKVKRLLEGLFKKEPWSVMV